MYGYNAGGVKCMANAGGVQCYNAGGVQCMAIMLVVCNVWL